MKAAVINARVRDTLRVRALASGSTETPRDGSDVESVAGPDPRWRTRSVPGRGRGRCTTRLPTIPHERTRPVQQTHHDRQRDQVHTCTHRRFVPRSECSGVTEDVRRSHTLVTPWLSVQWTSGTR